MRVKDVMSARPIVVTPGQSRHEVRRLMETGDVHHLPVVEGDQVLGVWLASSEGPLVLLGPEHVHETVPEADASEAMTALVDEAEAVVVWEAGVPAGVLTRTDVNQLVRDALRRGLGLRHARPLVVRVMGPAGAGKTTLLTRTLPLLPGLEIGLVQANALVSGDHEVAGARAVDAPDAAWRAGFARAVDRLADAQLILVEDRDGSLGVTRGLGEDLQVAVVPAAGIGGLTGELLEEAAAVVASRADEADPASLEAELADLRRRCPAIRVFAVAAGHDDRGMRVWARWLEGEVRRRHG
jgi:Ni2+-binding GTPase involved in maturation of urease and hydrogenase